MNRIKLLEDPKGSPKLINTHRWPKGNIPLANFWTAMLQDAGVTIERFADANETGNSIWG